MPVLPLQFGADNPILRKPTAKAGKVTRKIQKLLRDMEATMKDAKGVGLAAPQVGESVRVCLCQIGGKLVSMVDPDINWASDDMAIDEEGCLSLPGIWLPVPRHVEIRVTYTDGKGQPQERHLKNMDARVVQHEVDHLEGILIVDYRKIMEKAAKVTE